MKMFSLSCMLLSVISFIFEMYARGAGSNTLPPYTTIFVLAGGGVEIVRSEIEKIKRQLAGQIHGNEHSRPS